MEKALQRLADAKMTSMSNNETTTADKSNEMTSQVMNKVDIAVVDTPPNTPKIQNSFVNPALKGIPKALLERVCIELLFKINTGELLLYTDI